jgi:hypothetical protein
MTIAGQIVEAILSEGSIGFLLLADTAVCYITTGDSQQYSDSAGPTAMVRRRTSVKLYNLSLEKEMTNEKHTMHNACDGLLVLRPGHGD